MKSIIKKSIAMLLTLIVLSGTLATGGKGFAELIDSFAVTASAATNPYPTSQSFQYNGKWYTTVPCTWYAWQQVYDRLGIALPAWGNAGTWLDYATGAGYATGTSPRVNSLAVWKDSGWGHVAFVTAVSGSSWTYNEGGTANSRADANGIYVGHPYPDGYTSYPAGFIYLTPSHTCDFKASAKITKAPTQTATGTRVRTCSCGKTYTETIPAIPYTTGLAEGIYTITTKCKSGLQIATNSNSNYDAFIAEGNYADQYWIFRKNSDGTYTIENAYYNGKVLDVEGLSMVNAGNIFACNYNGGDNQKFYVIPSGSYYKLVAKNSYLNMDNSGARTNSGNSVIQYENNGSDAQLWALKLSNPPLNLSATSLTLSPGSSATVNCTVGRETYGNTIYYNIANSSVCSAKWNGWNGMTNSLTVTAKNAGTTTITITNKDTDTGIAYAAKTITVTVPDTTKPTASITSTNSVATSQTATLALGDNVNLAGYYWGTSSSYSSNAYTTASGTSKSISKTITSAGTYYLTAKDAAGNISSTVSKTFYKTTLNANNGSVSPASVITMSGNSFGLPTPSRSGYTFLNWNTRSDGTGTAYSAGTSYKPAGNVTLYAQWKTNHIHSYSKTVTSPTCTQSGYTTYTCSCGESYKADYTPAAGHNYTKAVTPPSCTQSGYTTYTCFCGKSYKSDYTDAHGHRFTKYVYNNDATTEKDGTETAQCDYCNATDTRTSSNTRLNPKLYVRTLSIVDYRTIVTVTATAADVPDGCVIALFDGNRKIATGDRNKVSYKVGEMTSSKVYTARIINPNNNTVIKDKSETELKDQINIAVNDNFLTRLIAFFKAIIGILPEVEIKP